MGELSYDFQPHDAYQVAWDSDSTGDIATLTRNGTLYLADLGGNSDIEMRKGGPVVGWTPHITAETAPDVIAIDLVGASFSIGSTVEQVELGVRIYDDGNNPLEAWPAFYEKPTANAVYIEENYNYSVIELINGVYGHAVETVYHVSYKEGQSGTIKLYLLSPSDVVLATKSIVVPPQSSTRGKAVFQITGGDSSDYFASYKIKVEINQGTTTLTPKASDTTDPLAIALNADFNADGVVSNPDFLIWQANTGNPRPPWNGDANYDGDCDGTDFGIWQAEYSETRPERPAWLD